MLTGCGLEVEGLAQFHSVKGGLRGVVIGEVVTCERHPGSDHLTITTVDVGAGVPLNIVCGAANVRKGQKVPVATPGTTLCFGDREVTITPTKIRGERSEGMICAEDELGLGVSHEGIMVLAGDAPVGMPAATYFNIEEDMVFTIGLTPNRVDAASHVGVARDLVAVANNFGRDNGPETEKKAIRIPDVSGFHVDNDSLHIPVIIEDSGACPRYSGITVSGIRVGDSPAWLKNRLSAAGLRPINNIVDITNYVLLELGQPLHAFDCESITGNTVIVRKYPAGTRFTTLDGVERELTADDLMICNASEPMCIAGIFGGMKSGVTGKTTSVFLESACFDPKHIRRSSRHHGLQTDASFRFERGANVDITVYALKRAAMMIREIAGGEISSEVVDVCPVRMDPCIVGLSWKNLDRLVGKRIHRDVVKSILSDLEIVMLEEIPEDEGATGKEPGLRLEIPRFKVDVTREADVIEEILRIYGYNNVEPGDVIRASISHADDPDAGKVQNAVSDYLAANGFCECMNNSLTRTSYYDGNSDYPAGQCVRILNPLSRDLEVMRQTLLFGMMETVVYNQNRQIPDLRLFEFGKVYSARQKHDDPLPGYHEENHLALAMSGRAQPENWNTHDLPVCFHDLKAYLEGIFSRLEIARSDWEVGPYNDTLLSEGLQGLSGGQPVFTFGAVSAEALKRFDCRQAVYYAEIRWDLVFSLLSVKKLYYKGIPRFPEVRRDMALLVDKEVTFAGIRELAFKTEKKLLKSIGLFDVYEGDKIPAGKKSYALSLILQDEEKTLTDREIDAVMEKIVRAMVTGLDAMLR